MDFKRAQEIVNSSNHIEVLYEGKAVWIAGLNPHNKTAEIQQGPQAVEGKKEVAVQKLVDNGVIG
ncbi:small, acid-soluble spore protein, H family [Natronincola ferrireducens]|uniref:Small acid-soluble spore protein H (Minor) n=1 Tax=Natronincola ferrireducens TaxID=393762 RepID=A0A1G9H1R7_9FIRM|nr:small, acid-soluble spore protein, H family [Natronincola ferrireducens]SDL06900.1 small acid-soluble spore protein H (minor) [Natronincola ferrireducens]